MNTLNAIRQNSSPLPLSCDIHRSHDQTMAKVKNSESGEDMGAKLTENSGNSCSHIFITFPSCQKDKILKRAHMQTNFEFAKFSILNLNQGSYVSSEPGIGHPRETTYQK